MSLVNYDPLFSVRQLQDDINRLFSGWSTNDSSSVTADWIPSVEIALESGVLTITGERYLQAEKSDENVVRRRTERGTGGGSTGASSRPRRSTPIRSRRPTGTARSRFGSPGRRRRCRAVSRSLHKGFGAEVRAPARH